jgi:hypothetical protein
MYGTRLFARFTNNLNPLNETMTLNLKKFDITTITDDSVVVFIGKRKTGKSWLLKNLLYYHRDIPIATIISSTESANKFYGDIVPSLFIHDEISPALLDNVVKRQKIIRKQMDKLKRRTGSCNIDPRALLVLDDCLHDKSWVNMQSIREIFLNGRHWKMFFMLTMQHPLGIPPSLRTNIDFVFISRENNINNRKRIYDNYASMFPSFDMFCTVMDQCTENYECLVVQINAQSNKLQDQVFWYKAQVHEHFKLGAKEFWDAHKENVDDDTDDEEMFDASLYKKKKHHVSVNKKS